jgi:hypothetical protein
VCGPIGLLFALACCRFWAGHCDTFSDPSAQIRERVLKAPTLDVEGFRAKLACVTGLLIS